MLLDDLPKDSCSVRATGRKGRVHEEDIAAKSRGVEIEEVTPEGFQRVAQACFAGERFTQTTIGPLARIGAAPVPA